MKKRKYLLDASKTECMKDFKPAVLFLEYKIFQFNSRFGKSGYLIHIKRNLCNMFLMISLLTLNLYR